MPSLASSLISLLIIVFFLVKAPRNAMTVSFVLFQSLVFLWPLPGILHAALIQLCIYNELIHYFGCTLLTNIVICFTGTSWLLFCLAYTQSPLLKKRSFRFMLGALPVLYLAFSMAKRYLFVSVNVLRDRLWFILLTLLLYFIVGSILLFIHAFKQPRRLKKQNVLLVGGICFAILCILFEAVYSYVHKGMIVSGFSNYVYYGLLPTGFILSSVTTALAIFKFRFLNLIPIAVNEIFDHLPDAVVLFDKEGRIVRLNDAFAGSFGGSSGIKPGSRVEDLVGFLRDRTLQDRPCADLMDMLQKNVSEAANVEITSREPRRFYMVSLQPLCLHIGETEGFILTLRDMTEYRTMLNRLEDYSLSVAELSAVRERNRLSRELHDTIGHTLTMVLTLVKMSRSMMSDRASESERLLGEAEIIARQGIRELRSTVSGLSLDFIGPSSLSSVLDSLFDHFRRVGLEVSYSSAGCLESLSDGQAVTLYRVCQEALTNAVRHGKATKATVVLKIDEGVRLLIIDNGCGCKSLIPGFGMKGMEQRVHTLNGTLRFGSDGENGFNLFVELPPHCDTDMEQERKTTND